MVKNIGHWLHWWESMGLIPCTVALCLLSINALQTSFPQSSHLTLWWTCFWWSWSFDRYPKLCEHWSHLCVALFSCFTIICSWKSFCRLNSLAQYGHFFSFGLLLLSTSLWTFMMWEDKLCLLMKTWVHWSQMNSSLSKYSGGRPPWWDWWCWIYIFGAVNLLSQDLHLMASWGMEG